MSAAAALQAAAPAPLKDVAVGEGAPAEAPGEAAAAQEDLYTRLKTLQRQLEFLEIQARGGARAGPVWRLPPTAGRPASPCATGGAIGGARGRHGARQGLVPAAAPPLAAATPPRGRNCRPAPLPLAPPAARRSTSRRSRKT